MPFLDGICVAGARHSVLDVWRGRGGWLLDSGSQDTDCTRQRFFYNSQKLCRGNQASTPYGMIYLVYEYAIRGGIYQHCTTHRRTTALHKRGSLKWPPSQLDSRYQFPDTTYQHQHESRPFGRYQSVASYSHSHSPYSPHSLTSPAASPSLIFSVMLSHAPASVFQDPDSHKS